MSELNLKKTVHGTIPETIERLTEALKKEGFGILTRIDLHEKFKEKLGKEIRPVVVLGACHPEMAFEAFSHNTDFASLLPCNAVVRDLGGGKLSVELAKPTAMIRPLGNEALTKMAVNADTAFARVLDHLVSDTIR